MYPPAKKKRCQKCKKWFTPHHNNPHQQYCSSPDCQRARKSLWRSENYLPHDKLTAEERDRENERCCAAMRKLRSLRKLAAAVKISSGHTITSGDAAFRSSIFLGAMSMVAGTQDYETVRNICQEAYRRGQIISERSAKYGP